MFHLLQMRRTSEELKSQDTEGSSSLGNSKYAPQSVKASSTKQQPSECMRSPVSDGSRNSTDKTYGLGISPVPSIGSSKRITELSAGSGRKQSKRVDSFREEERVIKIEES